MGESAHELWIGANVGELLVDPASELLSLLPQSSRTSRVLCAGRLSRIERIGRLRQLIN